MKKTFSEVEVRAALARGLRHAGVFYLRDNHLETSFINGEHDIDLSEIGLDSLSTMELCIFLELEGWDDIVPENLKSIKSVQALARRLAKAM